MNNDIPTSLSGTVSYSVSIFTLVQISNHLNTYLLGGRVILCLHLHFHLNPMPTPFLFGGIGSNSVSISTFSSQSHYQPEQWHTTSVFVSILSYSMSSSTLVQIPNQPNSYSWMVNCKIILCIHLHFLSISKTSNSYSWMGDCKVILWPPSPLLFNPETNSFLFTRG